MKILTAKQMAKLDSLSIVTHKIPARRLMGNAARRCCEEIVKESGKPEETTIVIVCGPGNNGGDGLAMGQFLREDRFKVRLFFTGKREKLSSEAGYFYDNVLDEVEPLRESSDIYSLRKSLKGADWVVDALFGTGLDRELKDFYKDLVSLMNKSSGRKLAVDIPSGISGDSGQVLGCAFKADITVTFQLPKWGQLQPSAWDYVGDLRVRPIGLHHGEIKKMKSAAEWIDPSMIANFFSPRSKSVNKGDSGKVLIIAGSSSMPGAGYLASMAALRTGSGLVTWAMPEEAQKKMKIEYPEVILHTFPSSEGEFSPIDLKIFKDFVSRFDAVAIGPGLGQGEKLEQFFSEILKKIRIPIVLDADGLNLVAKNHSLLSLLKGAILTPHPKEMSRLCGETVEEILSNRIEVARRFAEKNRLWLVLKGYRSVIAGPKGEIFINSTGGPNLAVAGSGDVLTGCIVSLLGQGMNAKQASTSGVFLHGRAGDLWAEEFGDRGTLVSEVAGRLPQAIQELIH